MTATIINLSDHRKPTAKVIPITSGVHHIQREEMGWFDRELQAAAERFTKRYTRIFEPQKPCDSGDT